MSRRLGLGILLLTMLVAGAPERAAAADEVKLRGWYVGVQSASGERDRWDVFGRDGLPPAPVQERGRGGGFVCGHRFGGRFLLGLQVLVADHDLEGADGRLHDGEALITGTVLFRERRTLQPFVRGGLGGTAAILDPSDAASTTSLGTAAIVAAGLQVRLSSRFSLEWELAGRFANYMEVNEDGGDDWKVRVSSAGWRSGLAVMFWF